MIQTLERPTLRQQKPMQRNRPSVLKAAASGATAGLIATVPMTAFMLIAHRRLPWHERYPLPPARIMRELERKIGIWPFVTEETHTAATYVSHFGYGSAAGAVYGPIGTAVRATAWQKGALWGLIVWFGSYMGLLPALNILRPATQHPWRRNVLMIVAHFIYGISLAWLTERFTQHTKKSPMQQSAPNTPLCAGRRKSFTSIDAPFAAR
jgi:uncharacterized membrane protein YagU involved in acid resistance